MKNEEQARSLFGISSSDEPKWKQFLICSFGFFFGYLVNGIIEEEEQQSPVSVLVFQYEKDEEPISSFNQSLVNMERAKQKLKQKIRHFECPAKMYPTNLEEWTSRNKEEGDNNDDKEEETDDVEEKPKWMQDHVNAISSLGTNENNLDKLLLDFFKKS